MNPLDNLIVALDVTNMERALNLVSELDRVKCFKIGPQLFLRGGEGVVNFIKKRDAKVLLDLKLYDIHNVVIETAMVLDSCDVDYLTIHASVGYDVLKDAVQAAPNLKILSVVSLTNEHHNYFSNFEPKEKITMSKHCGVAGCVTSGAFISDVKMRFPDGMVIVPGVRLQNEMPEDQICTISPECAIKFGADKIIMGRSICRSENPNKIIDEVLERIKIGHENK